MLSETISKSFPRIGEFYSGQANRTIGYVSTGGAEIGEAVATLKRINSRFFASSRLKYRRDYWYEEWDKVAIYVESLARTSKEIGRELSARQAYMRAAEYYRQSAFFLRDDLSDERLISAYRKSYECFDLAIECQVGDWTAKKVNLKWGDGELRGRLFMPLNNARRDSVCFLLPGGYDSTISEVFNSGVLALRRGYHVFVFDGPGQGISVLEGHFMIPNFEKFVEIVLNTLGSNENSSHLVKFAIMGRSFGGYLVPRALTKLSHRFVAGIVDPGQIELLDKTKVSPVILRLVEGNQRKKLDRMLRLKMYWSEETRFFWKSKCLVHGLSEAVDLLLTFRDFTIRSDIGGIKCPMLVLDNPLDTRSNRGINLYNALDTDKTLVSFNELDGASDHCEAAATSNFERIVFDWLDHRLQSSTIVSNV